MRTLARFTNPPTYCRAPLLHYADAEGDASYPDWSIWLRARGASPDARLGPRFKQSAWLIEQAVAGKGVALAKEAIAQEDMESGRLSRC